MTCSSGRNPEEVLLNTLRHAYWCEGCSSTGMEASRVHTALVSEESIRSPRNPKGASCFKVDGHVRLNGSVVPKEIS